MSTQLHMFSPPRTHIIKPTFHTPSSHLQSTTTDMGQAASHVADFVEEAIETVKNCVGKLITDLKTKTAQEFYEDTKEYITNKIKLVAFQTACVGVALVPAAFATPALAMLGFGGGGPIAGRQNTATPCACGWLKLMRVWCCSRYACASLPVGVRYAGAVQYAAECGDRWMWSRGCSWRGDGNGCGFGFGCAGDEEIWAWGGWR